MDPGEHRSWTRRAFEAAGGSAPRIGLGMLAIATAAFALQELVLGRFALVQQDPSLLVDMRIAVTHIVIAVYMVAASVYYEQARDAAVRELRDRFGEAVPGSVGLSGPATLAALALGAAIAVLFSLHLSPGPTSYAPSTWSPESGWHRVLGVVLGLTTSRLFFLIAAGSAHVSDSAAAIGQIDLLEPERLGAFPRIGLTGALLSIGGFSVYALFLIDPGYLTLVAGLFVTSVVLGALALFLPLRGVRLRVREAKREELGWCRAGIRRARARLAGGEPSGDLEELLAWEARMEGVSEWPVDASTLGRFGLYLLIPLGSWAGAAMVERAIDALLD